MLQLKILFRNAFHNKLRSGLTILGITVAILAFGLLRTVIGAWYAGVEAASASRLVTRNAISIIFPLPISYDEKIRQIEGVKLVSYGNWFGGIYIDEKNFFPNFCVEPRTYLAIYPEFVLSPAEKKAFLADRKGFVAGRKLAARYRLEDRRSGHPQGDHLSRETGISSCGASTGAGMRPSMRRSFFSTGITSMKP